MNKDCQIKCAKQKAPLNEGQESNKVWTWKPVPCFDAKVSIPC